MTRQPSKLKNLFFYLLLLVELVCLLGAYIVDYTTKHRMGMQRHMVYLNGQLEAKLPIELVRWIFIGLLVLMIVGILLDFRRKAASPLRLSISLLLGLGALFFILFIDKSKNRSYYYIAFLLFMANIFENLRFRLRKG